MMVETAISGMSPSILGRMTQGIAKSRELDSPLDLPLDFRARLLHDPFFLHSTFLCSEHLDLILCSLIAFTSSNNINEKD